MEQNPETANAYHSNVSDASVWTNSKYVLHHYYSEFEDQIFFFFYVRFFRIEMRNVFFVRIHATWITKYDFDIGSLCCYYSYIFYVAYKIEAGTKRNGRKMEKCAFEFMHECKWFSKDGEFFFIILFLSDKQMILFKSNAINSLGRVFGCYTIKVYNGNAVSKFNMKDWCVIYLD